MSQLIIVCVTILVLAAAAAIGVSAVPSGVVESLARRGPIVVGLARLEAEWRVAVVEDGTPPSAPWPPAGRAMHEWPVLRDPDALPDLPGGMAWSYGGGASGWWFCLSADPSQEADLRVLAARGRRAVVGAACGAAVPGPAGTAVSATWWMSKG